MSATKALLVNFPISLRKIRRRKTRRPVSRNAVPDEQSIESVNNNEAEVIEETDFTSFVQKVRKNKIGDVYMKPSWERDNTLYYSTEENGVTIHGETNGFMTEKIVNDMIDHGVRIHVENTTSLLSSSVVAIILLAFFYASLIRALPQRLRNDFSFEDKDEISESNEIRFEDIAGIDEVIDEVNEYVDFLKNPGKYDAAGAVIPAGCLLHGSPGTGKTMIAKAIATEAGVPFIQCSASEFVELFVGMGASRVRTIFKTAREKSPCIMFIDEIDAIGKQRSSNPNGGSNDEREQTLNQILTEMDGFVKNEGVVVMAATNRIDTLDQALIRPGRFDRKVFVPLPNLCARKSIIEIYTKSKLLDDDVNIADIAAKTPGSAGAELKNIVNEAAISAARDDRVYISKADIDYAIEKVNVGLPRKITYTIEEKKRVAVHEIGHALVSILLEAADTVDKVSILPIGEAGGITTFIPGESNLGLYTYDYLINKIKVALGGHACEHLVFGSERISTGASADFRQVTSIATSLVNDLGYSSKIGKLAIDRETISDQMRYDVEKEVYRLVKKCYRNVYNMLKNHKQAIDKICEILIVKETISGKEMLGYLTFEEEPLY
tara:strand:+ start:3198 stop:5018 length:1821 start_codon:yes stop_codon:yes gene_type:complete